MFADGQRPSLGMRLAVGAASALVTFAFQTHMENPPEA